MIGHRWKYRTGVDVSNGMRAVTVLRFCERRGCPYRDRPKVISVMVEDVLPPR